MQTTKHALDAGFDVDTLEGMVGAVIRDHHGTFIATANEKIDLCFDSFTAEAVAGRFEMNLTHTVGWSKNGDQFLIVWRLLLP